MVTENKTEKMTFFNRLVITPLQWLVIIIGGMYLIMIYLVEKDVYSLQDYLKTIYESNVTVRDLLETASRNSTK